MGRAEIEGHPGMYEFLIYKDKAVYLRISIFTCSLLTYKQMMFRDIPVCLARVNGTETLNFYCGGFLCESRYSRQIFLLSWGGELPVLAS